MTLTEQQKQEIIDSYNAAQRDSVYAEMKIDYYTDKQLQAEDEKHRSAAARKESSWDARHSFDIGIMEGIDRALEIIGLSLVTTDEDIAVDIEGEVGA